MGTNTEEFTASPVKVQTAAKPLVSEELGLIQGYEKFLKDFTEAERNEILTQGYKSISIINA